MQSRGKQADVAGSDDYPRSHRVADFIQRELSGMISNEIRDPRMSPMLTIASVEVSRDLSVAKVYYSLLDREDRVETQAALKRASGFLRRRLAQEMRIRAVPELRFHYDDSAEKGARMSALIDQAVASNTTPGEGAEASSIDASVPGDAAGRGAGDRADESRHGSAHDSPHDSAEVSAHGLADDSAHVSAEVSAHVSADDPAIDSAIGSAETDDARRVIDSATAANDSDATTAERSDVPPQP